MIYVECDPDVVLTETIYAEEEDIFSVPEQVIHAGSRSQVITSVEKNSSAKGLIDEDPLCQNPTYIRNMNLNDDYQNCNIKVLKDDDKNNTIVILSPRHEEWILRACELESVDVTNYGLPNSANRLHDTINVNIEKYKQLLEDLMPVSQWISSLTQALQE